jgi:hypothetical protein
MVVALKLAGLSVAPQVRYKPAGVSAHQLREAEGRDQTIRREGRRSASPLTSSHPCSSVFICG